MKILLSNDDGYLAPGLIALHEALAPIADEIVVVAPDSNRSGSSNSLTLDRPLSVFQADNGFYFCNGTPSDCVHIALTGILKFRPDIVVSGINQGQNMGDDTLYSGTVAAASEGYLFGIPAIAFSLAEKGWEHIDSAARAARLVVERHLAKPLAAPVLLNVNIPNRRFEDMHGFAVTRLGKRHPSQPVVRTTTPYGDTVYWIGPVGLAADATPGTDFHAVEQGTVSVTPLRLDLTQHSQLDEIRTWAEPLCANA